MDWIFIQVFLFHFQILSDFRDRPACPFKGFYCFQLFSSLFYLLSLFFFSFVLELFGLNVCVKGAMQRWDVIHGPFHDNTDDMLSHYRGRGGAEMMVIIYIYTQEIIGSHPECCAAHWRSKRHGIQCWLREGQRNVPVCICLRKPWSRSMMSKQERKSLQSQTDTSSLL